MSKKVIGVWGKALGDSKISSALQNANPSAKQQVNRSLFYRQSPPPSYPLNA
jgi:hypothetical protein